MLTLKDLAREFPTWTITDEGPRFAAKMPHWGAYYGQSVQELRERLVRWRQHHERYPDVSGDGSPRPSP